MIYDNVYFVFNGHNMHALIYIYIQEVNPSPIYHITIPYAKTPVERNEAEHKSTQSANKHECENINRFPGI